MHRDAHRARATSTIPPNPPSTARAHVALAVTFVAFGALDGTWAARLPALKHRLGLDSGQLGLVLFIVTGVATLLLPVAGWLAARLGSRAPTALGLVLACAGLTGAAFAPSYATLIIAVCVLGAGWGIADVAANAHGVALEARMGRPILSVLHGMWSFGLLAGSGIAAGAAAAAISPRLQFPVVVAAALVLVAIYVPRLMPGTKADAESAHFALPRGALALPAFLTFCALFIEFGAMNWSAVFLAGPVSASAAVAAGAVVVYAVSMAFARLAGDRLLLRWGVGRLARYSGVLTCLGIALALATRSPVPALAGFGLVGAGCAAIVPALFRFGGSVPGVSSGAGIAAVATSGYAGAVVSGPAIGFLARGIGLTGAMSLIGVSAAIITLLGPRLEQR